MGEDYNPSVARRKSGLARRVRKGSAMQAVLELDVRTERGNVALMNSPRIHCATEDEPRILKALEKEEKIQSRH